MERKLYQQCPLETYEYDLDANLHTGYFSPAVFGANLGLGEYWKSYCLIQTINNLQLGVLSKMLIVFSKMLDVNMKLP